MPSTACNAAAMDVLNPHKFEFNLADAGVNHCPVRFPSSPAIGRIRRFPATDIWGIYDPDEVTEDGRAFEYFVGIEFCAFDV